MSFTSYEVDNDKAFEKAINRAREAVGDLTLPFNLISDDFYKSQAAIFNLKSPGQYPDFGGINPTPERTEKAKKAKQRRAGFIYPLLVGREQRIKQSTTRPDHPEAINKIDKGRVLVIGTTVPYAVYHQSDDGRTVMPQRKFLFIGPEAPKFANSQQQGRLERWLRILQDYVESVFEARGGQQ